MCVAADEIERLRAELQQSRLNHLTTLSELQDAAEQSHRLRAERDAERALADQLADAILSASVEEAIEKTDDALAAYEEARREQ